MEKTIRSNQYDDVIKNIKRRRKVVVVLTIVALIIAYFVSAPFKFEVAGETIVDYKGVNAVISAIFVIAIFICEFMAYVLVSNPMQSSMFVECDPYKHMVLNSVLNKQKNKDYIFAIDYMYLGEFATALDYANKMVDSKKTKIKITGFFNKARCEFFLEDFDSLKRTVSEFESVLSNIKSLKPKEKEAYDKIQKLMKLLVAVSKSDKEEIEKFRDIEVWNNSKATEGFVNYIKGVAAYTSGDKEEAIYRLMLSKEICKKTVFKGMAEQYLSKMRTEL